MAMQFQSTQLSDLEDIAKALIVGFNASADARFADRKLLNWKYFEDGPEWEGSRSYVLRKDAVIKAHCGIWPMNLEFSGQRVTCNSFVDWISDRNVPGAGVLLKKKLLNFTDTGIVVGGTKDTRRVVPRIGFEQVGEVVTFARVVRPWQQYASRPKEQRLKGMARLARNASWHLSGRSAVPPGWSSAPVESFGDWLTCSSGSTSPTPARTAQYLNYWLRLPGTPVLAFSILYENETRGYFLLSKVGKQTRIADIRLFSGGDKDWTTAYSLAVSQAEADVDTCEILTIASTQFANSALTANGFRDRGHDPMFVYDPKGKLKAADSIFLNLIDGDGAYLYDPEFPYVT
jgi:hypothetical protein